MHVGMLWFDDNPKLSLTKKVEKAVLYYQQKYHRQPNLCLIHPTMITGDGTQTGKTEAHDIEGLTIRPYRPILPGHLWIGIEDGN